MRPEPSSDAGHSYRNQYRVVIDLDALPKRPEERIAAVLEEVLPVVNTMISDAATVAIGTWPTPERPGTTETME